MAAHTYEFILTDFQFPARLPGRQANFRMVVDLRYVSRRGDHTEAHAVLPGLDTWWECDPERSEDPGYVRGARAGKRVALTMDAIPDWDRLILLVRGDGVHSIQFRVFDVDRADAWDRITGAFLEVVPVLLSKGREAVPDLGGLVEAPLGSAAADLEAITVSRIAGGDRLLFRGSSRLTGSGSGRIGGRGVGGTYRIGFDINEIP